MPTSAPIYVNIAATLDRADEVLADLKREYEASLQKQTVSYRALQLTHEVCAHLRSVLDRMARRYWQKHIQPDLSPEDCAKALHSIYFPVAPNQAGLDSILGRWRWKAVRPRHQKIYDYLLNLQPFQAKVNRWLEIMNDLSAAGIHIDLIPQERQEERRTTVSHQSGASVSWGAGVRFGSGIRVMGAPIDPATQMPVPTPDLTVTVTIWVGFLISGYDVNALGFCEAACRSVRAIAQHMTNEFSLS